ncbi:MAG TPA: sigma-54 dependent transcriptional regulator [bacterium]|mgnify:FL=1|nr:sigma-54 dependent transcriptional regulator [bacterium]
MNKVLLIDDDKTIGETLRLHLSSQGFEVTLANRVAEGRKLWPLGHPDLVLLDLKLPDGSGLDLLREATRERWSGSVIMITGYQDMTSTIDAMKLGAFDYLLKPLNLDEFDLVIEKAMHIAKLDARLKAINREHTEDFNRYDIVGGSPAIYKVIKQIGLAANNPVTVLVQGESGTGKELVTRVLHRATNPEEPFVAINCSAMVETLLESELFGHEKGSFTSAHTRKIGKLEFAGAGTVFLDEISELSLNLQAKLLRVIQEREFERVGGLKSLPLKARIVTATNRNLKQLVQEGRFREDLFYRLQVFTITLPPLREHREDIPQLVEHLLKRINIELHKKIVKVADGDLERLMAFDWPGNVRELHNVLIRAAVASKGDVLVLGDFGGRQTPPPDSLGRDLPSLKELEKEHIERVLRFTKGNYGEACQILGITRPTLRKKLDDYNLRDSF